MILKKILILAIFVRMRRRHCTKMIGVTVLAAAVAVLAVCSFYVVVEQYYNILIGDSGLCMGSQQWYLSCLSLQHAMVHNVILVPSLPHFTSKLVSLATSLTLADAYDSFQCYCVLPVTVSMVPEVINYVRAPDPSA
jgi:hypothetical protein